MISYTGEHQGSVSSDSAGRGLLLLLKFNPMCLIHFREEAQHVWEKREAQWEKERKARERLMQEVDWFSNRNETLCKCNSKDLTTKQQLSFLLLGKVLAGRQQQLELKVQRNREAQEESLKRREELIQELELERKIRRQETEQEEGRRTARMQEINAQVRT